MNLARARARITATLMPDTAQIQRTTLIDDNQGGSKTGTPAIIATVSCGIRTPRGKPDEQMIAERLAGRAYFIISLPVGTDVQEADRILVGSRTFEVIKPLVTSLALSLPVVCVEE